MKIYIGTSGYDYDTWVSNYYKTGTNKLDQYMNDFKSVELNSTYYQIPKRNVWQSWADRAKQHRFVYSVKAYRSIVASRDPVNIKKYWGRFWNGCQLLDNSLGCILLQYSGKFKFDADRTDNTTAILDYLTKLLPKNVKFAFEFRHSSMFNSIIYKYFQQNKNWTIVVNHIMSNTQWFGDLVTGFHPELPIVPKLNLNFLYFRLHGTKGKYIGSYSISVLKQIVKCVKSADVTTVFVYFNNTAHINRHAKLPDAIVDIIDLNKLLK
ncbi:MAG: hypothetical protein Faunusvirus1_51 [Faunusvirus sp.]|jgi:uncharacterized protein YecE (DUF72 family)|uniref:DUF72 domain-containing protein n=1 Tax=Faunusvirus sp. TaxID=2487766 RepID=A0A3G4ZYE5_9VIRU|nr:MAG: hypothetical protein Faunusvirus1_51 [Faunusvirus sp.]